LTRTDGNGINPPGRGVGVAKHENGGKGEARLRINVSNAREGKSQREIWNGLT